MTRRHWFLPETPDVLRLLRRQIAITIEGMTAFAAWASGQPAEAQAVRSATQRGDTAKRELLNELRLAFVTPLEPEDVFALSRGIDRILNYARDLIGESDAMACGPDDGIAEMAALLVQAVEHIDEAIGRLGPDEGDATEAADAAIQAERRLEGTYFRGMAALLDVEDRSGRIASRELYRRCSRIGETVVEVAERIVYAVVKQS